VLALGLRGTWYNVKYEIIGFQVRAINYDGFDYSWHEYLLFNPFHGFRYLTLYNGHWNFVQTVHGLPAHTGAMGHKGVQYNGVTYKHFQNAQARTTFVMGEFPWAVAVGETNTVDDYVAPPFSLACEQTADETNWSHATYVTPEQVVAAFQLPHRLPNLTGVYSNQPSPWPEKVRASWRTCLLLLIGWAGLLFWFTVSASNKEVFRHSYHYDQNSPGEHSFVTEPFEITGRGNVEIDIQSNLENNWAHFSIALLREDGDKGYDAGRDISYFHGSDSDGSWSEGSRKDDFTIPRVEAGRYYLRIEPEMDPQASQASPPVLSMDYDIVVKRGVPSTWLFWLVLPLLVIPPIINWFRSAAFESARWSESDYAAASSSSSGDDD